VVDDPGDSLADRAGIDTVVSSVSYTLGAGLEHLTLAGTAAIHATGNALGNTIAGNAASNLLAGGDGIDTVSYAAAGARVVVSLALAAAQNTQGAGTDTLTGFENLLGSAFHDVLTGSAGANLLNGGAGNDRLVGAGGRDVLIGGTGADLFDFNAPAESPRGATRDVVSDFSAAQGDRIDLATIDARTTQAGDQAFTFIAGAAFSGVAGQLRFAAGILEGDVNGDALADLQISLVGVTTLDAASLLL
jgi:Ca2+-binding RTX toxin-like protein